MKNILFKGLPEKFIEPLKNASDYHFIPYTDNSVNDDVALVILGEAEASVIPVIQKICKEDHDLGIVVIPSEPHLLNHMKVAIQFSPFIGQNVKITDTLEPDYIHEQARLTSVRRNFKKTRQHTADLLSDKLDNVFTANFLDKFLTQAPIGVVILDKDHKILDVNLYAQTFLKVFSQAISKKLPDVLPEHKKEVVEFLNKKKSPDEDNLILEINDPEAGKKYAQLFTSLVTSGNASYTMVLILDITRETLAEIKNEEYLQKLELHNKELEQFAFIVTHDIKNPLSTIKLSCEMAQEGTAEEKDHYISIINRSADNLIHMLEGLENLIDVRKDKGHKADRLEFSKTLDEVLNEYQYQIKTHNIDLIADFSKAPVIDYIESYLISIMHNMISNAIKYSRSNVPLKLYMETSHVDSFTLLKISDNGIGIDLNAQGEDLFQPFRRLTNQADGKGIGLSLIKSMIEKNNGKIEVESTPGEGTTFYCYLCPYSG